MTTEKDLNHVRMLLKEREQQLSQLLRQQDADEQNSVGEAEFTAYDNHPADQGSKLFEQEKELTLQEVRQQELNEVHQALQAIEDGSYGRCVICNKEIDSQRLMAVPTTKYCIDHA
ncbi:TraR/DksA C4-type zinc finger protein [Paraliobacillus salinarum]|uniref:TraR/DksA C4-type zinc finger protein n=1 Tax=Paraliobacillus salinarum TaxID=1158996 RepID=UPI0015F671C9|nr:TraR/DksA C4-type zinc finger protein [Paraliobacillus salinarum]